ncbi:hypothetical protein GDO81_024175 [Engystomops pustulosus]|uniref:Uncharacterized protein n=1 Tax=Engystomops pustulosus TaxID=76066 RepID=A0AAV6YJF3_ENGPU|nr:hypothetical protein GDO81_024175 [Engystomops pustulosus]
MSSCTSPQWAIPQLRGYGTLSFIPVISLGTFILRIDIYAWQRPWLDALHCIRPPLALLASAEQIYFSAGWKEYIKCTVQIEAKQLLVYTYVYIVYMSGACLVYTLCISKSMM